MSPQVVNLPVESDNADVRVESGSGDSDLNGSLFCWDEMGTGAMIFVHIYEDTNQ